MPQQKIKVWVTDLVAAIEARKAEALEQFEKEQARHETDFDKWQVEALRILNKAIEDVKKGKHPSAGSYYGLKIDEVPVKKSKLSTETYDRNINTLKMAVDEAISITVDDYAHYVR